MKQDLCPSRDFGYHIFERGVCVLCQAPMKPACEICEESVGEKEAQESIWKNKMILCQQCEKGEQIWGRMDDSEPQESLDQES